MPNQVVRLNANLRPDAAAALNDLADRIGGNRTTALHQAILLADLLYKEADEKATIQVKKLGSSSKTLVLPKINADLAKRVTLQLQEEDPSGAAPEAEVPEAEAGGAHNTDAQVATLPTD
jgi:hypothetical protein